MRNFIHGEKTPMRQRCLIVFVVILFAAAPASAMSVRDWDKMPVNDSAAYVGNFIEKMTADLGAKNPQLRDEIRGWFSRVQPGKRFSEGNLTLEAEILVLQDMAREGKADLSSIQIETVVVKVVKDKFLTKK
jgi:hypothetical protein